MASLKKNSLYKMLLLDQDVWYMQKSLKNDQKLSIDGRADDISCRERE
jgi:hypothetical protein